MTGRGARRPGPTGWGARVRGVLLGAALVLAAGGCGVGSEDAPVPIEGTPTESPAAPPSVDTETRPEPTSSVTSEPPPPSSRPAEPATPASGGPASRPPPVPTS